MTSYFTFSCSIFPQSLKAHPCGCPPWTQRLPPPPAFCLLQAVVPAMLEGNSAALQARPSPEVALLMDNPEVFYSLMHSFLHSTFFFLIDYQCWNQNNQTQVCPYSVVEGTDSEAKMTGGWDRSNVVASQHHREGHAHTVSVQKGT